MSTGARVALVTIVTSPIWLHFLAQAVTPDSDGACGGQAHPLEGVIVSDVSCVCLETFDPPVWECFGVTP